MTLIDFIDLSSEDEILKDHMAHTGGHNVHQGLDIIDLSSDEETAKEDYNLCAQGHAAVVQHQTSAHNGEAVLVPADDGSHQAMQSENAVEATSSILVVENGGLGTATLQEGAVKEDHNTCTQGRMAQHKAPFHDGQAVLAAAGAATKQAMEMESENTVQATKSFSTMENGSLDSTITSQNFPASSIAVPFPSKEYRAAAQTATSSPSSTARKAETSEAPVTPWRSPRLKHKHKGPYKSMLKLAKVLKSSHMCFLQSTLPRRKQNSTVMKHQKNKRALPATTGSRTQPKHGCGMVACHTSEATVPAP